MGAAELHANDQRALGIPKSGNDYAEVTAAEIALICKKYKIDT